jgi:hypothetical protein
MTNTSRIRPLVIGAAALALMLTGGLTAGAKEPNPAATKRKVLPTKRSKSLRIWANNASSQRVEPFLMSPTWTVNCGDPELTWSTRCANSASWAGP